MFSYVFNIVTENDNLHNNKNHTLVMEFSKEPENIVFKYKVPITSNMTAKQLKSTLYSAYNDMQLRFPLKPTKGIIYSNIDAFLETKH